MTGTMQNSVLIAIIVIVGLFIIYQYDSTLFGLLGRREGFDVLGTGLASGGTEMNSNQATGGVAPGTSSGPATTATTLSNPNGSNMPAGMNANNPPTAATPLVTQPSGTNTSGFKNKSEAFADLASFEGPANFASVDAPAGCYPRDQLTPSELLPADQNSIYAQQNPMGPGSLKGKNFLSAGALIGVNTVGQSLRNANLQIRSEPPNPQTPVSVFNNSTITYDFSHRPLEIGA